MDMDLGKLADQLGDKGKADSDIIQGTVTAVSVYPHQTFTVRLRGSTTDITGVRSLCPVVTGDTVWILRKGTFLLILSHQYTGVHVVGASGEPAFQNSWANYSNGWALAQFYKINGLVYVTGLVQGGASGTVIFQLPTGYRPGAYEGNGTSPTTAGLLAVDQISSGAGRVDISQQGHVIGTTSSSSYTSLWLPPFIAEA